MDKKLLELMKERDALPEGDLRREELQDELTALYESLPKEEQNVSPEKQYSFYLFGGDVTERLNEYMKTANIDYSYMHERYWVENLREFHKLVRNKGKMDLKNQPEWQNSAFIYDGELLAQDALGNINYGHFGKYCNIPDSVLIAAAGIAQFSAGNAEIENLYVFLDDPRDTFRILQGMELYEEQN